MAKALSGGAVVHELVDEIITTRKKDLRSRIRPPAKKPYMYLSQISVCARNNYYQMVAGEQRAPVDEGLQALFDSGNIWEREIIRSLMSYGFDVVQQQATVEIKHQGEVVGRGRIDGKIRYKRRLIPFEIKTTAEHTFNSIRTIDDMFKDEWKRRYVRQLLTYMYSEGHEEGFFIIADRAGHWKLLPLFLGNHEDFCEQALRSMTRAWEGKKAHDRGEKEPEPDRIEYHPKICGSCAFADTVCFPKAPIGGNPILNDPELEELLARDQQLYSSMREYEKVHDQVKLAFAGRPETTVGGRFLVRPTRRTRSSYDVKQLPDKVRESIRVETEFWVVGVDDLENPKPASQEKLHG